MWPFRRRTPPSDVVRLGELSLQEYDYDVLTVGQSRLEDSFEALALHPENPTQYLWCTLTPIVDPRMKSIADITISIESHIVGYLRPPALDTVISLLGEHNTQSLEVPARLSWGPVGPEVTLRLSSPA